MTGKAYRCTAHTYSAWGPAGPGQAGKLEHWERRGAREVERRHHAHGAHRELAHDRREALVALGVVHGRPLACAATLRHVRFLLVSWYLLGIMQSQHSFTPTFSPTMVAGVTPLWLESRAALLCTAPWKEPRGPRTIHACALLRRDLERVDQPHYLAVRVLARVGHFQQNRARPSDRQAVQNRPAARAGVRRR